MVFIFFKNAVFWENIKIILCTTKGEKTSVPSQESVLKYVVLLILF